MLAPLSGRLGDGRHQPGVGRRQQLGDDVQIHPPRPGDRQGRREVQAYDPTLGKAERAGADDLPGLVLLDRLRRVLMVRARLAIQAVSSAGARRSVVGASAAVSGPSAPLEVPAAEGPDAFFAAFSITWRRVNSEKNRSPTG